MTAWILCAGLVAAGCGVMDAADTLPAHSALSTLAVPEPPAPAPSRADPWLAEDKLQHFALSFAATAFAYAGARAVLDPDPALRVAGGSAFLAGVAKEVHDLRRGRWFSLKDLAWDAAGVALGLTLAYHIR